MKPFFVGQRVRVIRCPSHPEHVDLVGTVMTELHPHSEPVWRAAGVQVHAVDLPQASDPGDGFQWCFEPRELVPVYDDPRAGWTRLAAQLRFDPRSAELA